MMAWRQLIAIVDFAVTTPEPRRGPMTKGEELRIARQFLDDLLAHNLEVSLTRAPEPGHTGQMIRTVCDQNARWYRHFAKLYSSNRRDRLRWSKHKTLIKRRETAAALARILRGGGSRNPLHGAA